MYALKLDNKLNLIIKNNIIFHLMNQIIYSTPSESM